MDAQCRGRKCGPRCIYGLLLLHQRLCIINVLIFEAVDYLRT